MAERSALTAARIQQPSWRDSRLLIGLILILGSVALGSYLITRADDRVPMFAAAAGLIPGQALTPESVTRVEVQLGDDVAGYLSAREPLPSERVVLREVRAGELVPLTAIGSAQDAALSQVTIAVDPISAAPLIAGTVVDVFVNRPAGPDARDGFAGPDVLLSGVTVAGVDGSGRGLGSSGRSTAVRIMVPTAQVPELITAVDQEAKVTVVPVPGALTRPGG